MALKAINFLANNVAKCRPINKHSFKANSAVNL